MIEYLDNEIAFLEEKINKLPIGGSTTRLIVEKEILESHRKRYFAWLDKAKICQPLGSVMIVENTHEYLKGFRDGVLKVTHGN